MNFLDLKHEFECKLNGHFDFELLELHYVPYSFGSGMAAYRIKGSIIKVVFDGKEKESQLITSKPHDKYPDCSWRTVFKGRHNELMATAVTKLNALHGESA